MGLSPHLWQLFAVAERAVVTVQYHTPYLSCDCTDARDLTQWNERTIAGGIRQIAMSEAHARKTCPSAMTSLGRDFLF